MEYAHLSWPWIAIAMTVPLLAGGLLAFPLWWKGQPILGNIAGTTVIVAAAVALILRERVELDVAAAACIERGYVCWPEPSAFARFAIYAFIALVEMMVLFSVSLKVETTVRRRGYAPEWR